MAHIFLVILTFFYVEIVVVDGLVGEVVIKEVGVVVGEVVVGVIVVLSLAYTFTCRCNSCGFRDVYAY